MCKLSAAQVRRNLVMQPARPLSRRTAGKSSSWTSQNPKRMSSRTEEVRGKGISTIYATCVIKEECMAGTKGSFQNPRVTVMAAVRTMVRGSTACSSSHPYFTKTVT